MDSYLVKKNRTKFIRQNFFEFSFNDQSNDDIEPDRNAFNKIRHPAELHYLARIYNWDDGITVPRWIVDSPSCSKATANLIFWLTRPDYYMRYALDDHPSSSEEAEVLALIAAILEKHKKDDFSEFKIAFDPKEHLEDIVEKNPRWSIPEALYQELDGVNVCVEDEED